MIVQFTEAQLESLIAALVANRTDDESHCVASRDVKTEAGVIPLMLEDFYLEDFDARGVYDVCHVGPWSAEEVSAIAAMGREVECSRVLVMGTVESLQVCALARVEGVELMRPLELHDGEYAYRFAVVNRQVIEVADGVEVDDWDAVHEATDIGSESVLFMDVEGREICCWADLMGSLPHDKDSHSFDFAPGTTCVVPDVQTFEVVRVVCEYFTESRALGPNLIEAWTELIELY